MDQQGAPSADREDQELFCDSNELIQAQKEAIQQEIEKARKIPGCNPETEKSNFRDYDQSQTFFIAIRLNTFLESDHPARVVDLIIERLDLSRL